MADLLVITFSTYLCSTLSGYLCFINKLEFRGHKYILNKTKMWYVAKYNVDEEIMLWL